jgi:hypothetical protein
MKPSHGMNSVLATYPFRSLRIFIGTNDLELGTWAADQITVLFSAKNK